MHEFTIRGAGKLDKCLKLLYSEHIKFDVRVEENEKRKIQYVVSVGDRVDDETFERLKRMLELL